METQTFTYHSEFWSVAFSGHNENALRFFFFSFFILRKIKMDYTPWNYLLESLTQCSVVKISVLSRCELGQIPSGPLTVFLFVLFFVHKLFQQHKSEGRHFQITALTGKDSLKSHWNSRTGHPFSHTRGKTQPVRYQLDVIRTSFNKEEQVRLVKCNLQ